MVDVDNIVNMKVAKGTLLTVAKGTLLTELNYYDMEVVIPESETLKEVLCPAKRDWTLPEPFTTLSSGGLRKDASSMTMKTSRVSSPVWMVLSRRREPGSTPGP